MESDQGGGGGLAGLAGAVEDGPAVGAVEDVALVVVATEAAHAVGEVRDVDELVDEFFDLWIEGGGHGYLAPSSVVGFPV